MKFHPCSNSITLRSLIIVTTPTSPPPPDSPSHRHNNHSPLFESITKPSSSSCSFHTPHATKTSKNPLPQLPPHHQSTPRKHLVNHNPPFLHPPLSTFLLLLRFQSSTTTRKPTASSLIKHLRPPLHTTHWVTTSTHAFHNQTERRGLLLL